MLKRQRNPRDLTASISAALGVSLDDCGEQRQIEALRLTLRLCWEQMEMIVGLQGARAIALHSAKVATKQVPGVSLVSVQDSGLDLSGLETQASGGGEAELSFSLKALCVAIFQTLNELTGDVVVNRVLEDIKARRGQET